MKHAHIVLRAPRPSTDIGPQYRMLRRILQSLGFPTTIDWLPVSRWARGLTNPDSHVPALVIGWVADYPSPSTFLWALFSCRALKLHSDGNRNLSEYCNAAADRLMRRARALETTQPARAAQFWARVDRLFTRSGAAVAYANTANMSIVGPRLGDYESDPQLGGPLLDQLWIR